MIIYRVVFLGMSGNSRNVRDFISKEAADKAIYNEENGFVESFSKIRALVESGEIFEKTIKYFDENERPKVLRERDEDWQKHIEEMNERIRNWNKE